MKKDELIGNSDDERPMTSETVRPPHTPASRAESWGSVQKPKNGGGGRFRMSKIFGVV